MGAINVIYWDPDTDGEPDSAEATKIRELLLLVEKWASSELVKVEYVQDIDAVRGRLQYAAFIYIANSVDLSALEVVPKKYEQRFTIEFGEFYKKLNKEIARRIDGRLCVPSRLIDNKLIKCEEVHHLIYGEHRVDEFTHLMTMSPSWHTQGDGIHVSPKGKVVRTFEILDKIYIKIPTAQFRWADAYYHYAAQMKLKATAAEKDWPLFE